MNPYRDLDAAYRRFHRHAGSRQLSDLGNLDHLVEVIRHDTPDTAASDRALRELIIRGRSVPEATTVALYALAPALRARISRTATAEYHHDAVTELALVILDSDIDGARLAHRLVNRTHSRIWRSTRSFRTHGVLNVTTTVPCEPDRLALFLDRKPAWSDSIDDVVVNRLALERFCDAVEDAVADGVLPLDVWTVYRDHRIRRALVTGLPASTGQERVAAHRAARRLAPYVDAHLGVHAA
ncbi:MAG: hypothetical protein AB7H43_12415 [Acidimicrobiia bacterium]